MSTNRVGKPIEILLVEDNPGDVLLTREALNEGKILNNLVVAKDGMEAMKILNKEGEYNNQVRPDLILLDLNLPKKDGREVLAEIKNDPKLRQIPIAILTTSSAEEDILKSYDLHANCYITKPLDIEQFFSRIKAIEEFWVTIVTLPNGVIR